MNADGSQEFTRATHLGGTLSEGDAKPRVQVVYVVVVVHVRGLLAGGPLRTAYEDDERMMWK